MKTFWNIDKNLTAIKEWQPNCWIQVTCPTDEDQQELEQRFNIPDYFLSDISDTDERARYEYDDGWMLIILRIPYVKEVRSRTPYTTVPLGIIHKRDVTITVCYYETNMMIDFVSYQQKRGQGFTDYVDLIFRLFLSSAVWYLKRLKQISLLIEKAKHNLDHGVNNESLIGLSRLQDSLTYFITSIRGNETLLSKLKFKLQVDELDADLANLPADRPTVLFYHMYGEHGPRYHADSPAHAKVWTPECTDADLGACTKESIINAYDNAVRYTDGVLAGLVKRLKARTDIDAGFVYVSDHGESLGEGGLYLHGAPYFMAPSEQIRVPMVMWLSKDWSRTFGFDAANLAREPAGGVTHEHLYSTVLGMLGVQSTSRRPRWDLTDNRSSAAQ